MAIGIRSASPMSVNIDLGLLEGALAVFLVGLVCGSYAMLRFTEGHVQNEPPASYMPAAQPSAPAPPVPAQPSVVQTHDTVAPNQFEYACAVAVSAMPVQQMEDAKVTCIKNMVTAVH